MVSHKLIHYAINCIKYEANILIVAEYILNELVMFSIKHALLRIYYKHHEITAVAISCCSILTGKNFIFKSQKSRTVASEVAHTLRCNNFGSNVVAL